LWAVLGIGAAGIWQVATRVERRPGTERLVNQMWLERMQHDQRDMVRFFVLVEHEGHREGALGRGSRWRARVERFLWSLDGDLLRARFPQDEKNARVRVRTWRCAGEAPRPFELCLEIGEGEHKRRYFSRDEWKVRPHDGVIDDEDARAELSWLSPSLLPAEAAPAAPPLEPAAAPEAPSLEED
jgi:hypothetical protein